MSDVKKQIKNKIDELETARDALDIQISALRSALELLTEPPRTHRRRRVDRHATEKAAALLRSRKRAVTVRAGARAMGITVGTASARFAKLVREGIAERVHRGAYRAVEGN